MKSIEILTVGIRLLGIYMLFVFLGIVIGSIQGVQEIWSVGNSTTIIVFFGALILYFIAMILSVFCPAIIARLLLPKTKSSEVVFDGTAKDISLAAFYIFGVYMVAKATPHLFYHLLVLSVSGGYLSLKTPSVIEGMTTAVEIIVGVCLCLYAKKISCLLYRHNHKELNAPTNRIGDANR